MGEGDDHLRGHRLKLTSQQPLTALYGAHASEVRKNLLGFGVHPADADDLRHDVFLIVMSKGSELAEVERVDLWLREICRKVAAAHRRRGGRHREFDAQAQLESVADAAPTQLTAFERREDALRLHRAIAALDDEARDLIALHELGGLPLVDVAALVERDRKTVRKRLEAANRRLMRSFREHEARRSAQKLAEQVVAPRALAVEPPGGASSQLLAQNADITVGRVGPVLVAVWPGPPTLEALTLLDEHMRDAARRLGSGLVYLAVVEASTSTPNLAARQKITAMLEHHARDYGVYPHVLLGGFSWIVRPIMAGLALLAGAPGSMPFFGSVERAAAWLVSGYLRGGSLTADTLESAVAELRSLAARAPAKRALT
jgi:RNA polymerase sigma factor (sigma-70 family)